MSILGSLVSKYLAIIPARGGSKRLPKKNILPLNGKPLIQHSIEAALKSHSINHTVVTSDDDSILALSETVGVEAIKRPEALSSDTASSFDAIKHAIESIDQSYEYIVLLQPTSPLRNSQHIDEAIELLEKKNADAIVSVCECEHTPLWSNTLPENGSMSHFLKDELLNKRSQDLSLYYRLNGAIYICKTQALLENNSFFLKENIYAYIMPQEDSIDIDTKLDLLIAQTILNEKNG